MQDGMQDRRSFLKSALALGVALPAAGAALPAAAGPPLPRIERLGAVYLVDGWVLTRADVEFLFPNAL
jgi:hypothetical protein